MCKELYFSDQTMSDAVSQASNKLMSITAKIAKLKAEQLDLENELFMLIEHKKEGQQTYNFMDKAITIKTDFLFKVEPEKYFEFRGNLPEGCDPVVTKEAYSINKAMWRKLEASAPNDVKITLSEFVTKKDAKPSIKVSYKDK